MTPASGPQVHWDLMRVQLLAYHFPLDHRHIRREGQPTLATVHADGLAFVEFAGQGLERQEVIGSQALTSFGISQQAP